MFTVAETFSMALSLLSTLAAHAAHVIPCTRSSTRTSPEIDWARYSLPLTTCHFTFGQYRESGI